MRNSPFLDITNNRYGRLLVLSRLPNKGTKMVWLCQCDCGKTTQAMGHHLKTGKSLSCGCLRLEINTKHGRSGTREYYSWQSMKSRCYNPNETGYADYGGRGITVCDRWLESFENFFADMGERPSGQTVDRRDTNGNYEPNNCRWATDMEQVYNRRTSLLCTIDGVTKPVKQWCAELQIVHYETAKIRIRAGWPTNRAVLAPPHSIKCIADPNANMHS